MPLHAHTHTFARSTTASGVHHLHELFSQKTHVRCNHVGRRPYLRSLKSTAIHDEPSYLFIGGAAARIPCIPESPSDLGQV